MVNLCTPGIAGGGKVYDDDISGELLDSPRVEKAIAEEMPTYASHGVYRKVLISESYAVSGKAPVKVRRLSIRVTECLRTIVHASLPKKSERISG